MGGSGRFGETEAGSRDRKFSECKGSEVKSLREGRDKGRAVRRQEKR